jgi:hypothetical protein
MRYQVWACSVGDPATNATIFNRVFESSDVVSACKLEIAEKTSAKTVVVKIETLGPVSAVMVLVFERSESQKVKYESQWTALTDGLVRKIIEDQESLYLSGDVEWNPTPSDYAVVKKLLETGVAIYVGASRIRLDVSHLTEYVLSLRF